MAMRYIRPETMIMISNQWLTELRSLLEAIPLTAPLVPLIERIHAHLVLCENSIRCFRPPRDDGSAAIRPGAPGIRSVRAG
jgi:hypothetical protein